MKKMSLRDINKLLMQELNHKVTIAELEDQACRCKENATVFGEKTSYCNKHAKEKDLV